MGSSHGHRSPADRVRPLSVRPVSLCEVSARLTDPEQLKELLGIPFTPEQTACITAPPAPQVIVAGAGSGKTTVMAARVVWLVGTGQVAPEQVLGLTFTNKAAGELSERVRKALVARRGHRSGRHRPGQPPGRAQHLHVPRLRRTAPHRARTADRTRTHHPPPRRRHPLPAGRPRAARGPRPVSGADQVVPHPGQRSAGTRRRTRRASRPPRTARGVRHRAPPYARIGPAHQRRAAQDPRDRRGPPRAPRR